MKKFLVATLAAACMATALPTVGMAASTNYVSNDRPVKAETELRGASAPKLIIEKSSDHRDNFMFALNLSNAEWLYKDTGDIVPGIKYNVITSRSMIIEVDMKKFDARINDMVIPLETKIDDAAGVIDVTIDPKGSGVSGGTYTFAHVSFPSMAISISNVDTKGGSFDLSFKDDYPYAMANNRLFKLTLNNGFSFISAKDVEGTGKYAGIVEFKVDSSNKSIAYVSLSQYSAMSSGTMKISGIQTASSDATQTKTTALYVEPIYGEGGAISFNLEGFESTENIKTGTPVKFTIGSKGYLLNDKAMETDAAPFIDINGRTMLPLRALANAFNIADENIKWDDAAKTVTLTNKKGERVVATVDSTQLRVGTARVTMDTTAVIKDGRTYMPMRAVLNAMGIADSDIVWSDKEKTVLVYNK